MLRGVQFGQRFLQRRCIGCNVWVLNPIARSGQSRVGLLHPMLDRCELARIIV
jgi:hypothetical protein